MAEIVNDIIRMSEQEFQDVCAFVVDHIDDPTATIGALRSIGVPDHDIVELRSLMKPIDVLVDPLIGRPHA